VVNIGGAVYIDLLAKAAFTASAAESQSNRGRAKQRACDACSSGAASYSDVLGQYSVRTIAMGRDFAFYGSCLAANSYLAGGTACTAIATKTKIKD
jgi:hypothetical protein